MARKVSPAQRANRITFFLKGDLKNLRVAYLRAGAKLAKIRDEKLYRALKHETLEEYAEKRLGMRRAALYRYLQIYDWARKFHRDWLAKHPKGFIPELYDAYGLKWIEEQLEGEHVGRKRGRSSRRYDERRFQESSGSASSTRSAIAASGAGIH